MFKNKFFLLLSIFLLTSFFSLFIYVRMFLNTVINEERIIYIARGSGIRSIISELKKNKIINDIITTEIIIRFKTNNKPKIKYGEYLIKNGDRIVDVLNKIINNNVYYRSITFAEGLSTKSILKIINENKFLIGEIPNNIQEGTLLPQTYNFLKGDTKESLIKRMQNDMLKIIDKYWDNRDKNLPLKTKQDALILASIVEKETGIKEERKLVASVFINRLRINMPLQSDPTAIYGYAFGDTYKEKIIKTNKLIRMNSPYNTYKIKKLPPTPICNPGEESIKAVLNPAKTKYLFFVANGKGGHDFSENYLEHRKNIFKSMKKK